MSDSEEEEFNASDFKELSKEIERCKTNPTTSGMFVSGWDDADQDVELVKNPQENPANYILWAAENGNLEVARVLLTKQPELIHSKDSDGYTPLHRAAYSNHVHLVSYFLSAGANVKARTNLGWSPLHSACKWNNYGCVARLLAAGAEPTALSDGEQTPMHLAAAMSHSKATLLLLLIREDLVETANRLNRCNETPELLARIHGLYAPLFEMVLPAASHIKSLGYTCNPFLREQMG